jgi:hypothetical protein
MVQQTGMHAAGARRCFCISNPSSLMWGAAPVQGGLPLHVLHRLWSPSQHEWKVAGRTLS